MTNPPHSLALLPFALLALAAGSTQAAEYTLGASQAFTHIANPERTVTGAGQADVLSATGLNYGLTAPLGRHSLVLGASGTSNRYRDRSELNYNGYRFNSTLHWSTGLDIAGTAGATISRVQNDFLQDGVTPVAGRNLQTTQAAFVQGRYAPTRFWSVGLSSDWQSQVNRSTLAGRTSVRQKNFTTSLGWSPLINLNLSANCGVSDIHNLTADFNTTSHRCGYSGAYTLATGGVSNLAVNLGQSRVRQKDFPSTASWVGGLNWGWAPAGKWSLNLAAQRSLGTSNQVTEVGTNAATDEAIQLSAIGSTRNETLSANLNWAISQQVKASFGGSRALRVGVNTLSLDGQDATTETRDLLHTWNAKLAYQLNRQASASLGITGEHRTPLGDSALAAYSTRSIVGQFSYQFR